MGNILDQPGSGDFVLAEAVNGAGLVDGDKLCMGMRDRCRMIEVDDKMVVGYNLVDQLIQQAVLNNLRSVFF